VADVRVAGDETCENAGIAALDGTSAYHLLFHRSDPASPGLKELWVDSASSQIDRAIVSGVLQFDGPHAAGNADFDIRVTHANGFDVISRVSWTQDGYEGDYTYENYAFPPSIAALQSAGSP
jgi:hypothetical protein